MKKVIRLTEEDIHNLIKESVDNILKEHMGSFEVDGMTYPTSTDYINSKENTWHGVEGTRVIWHGEWSDYEVEYNGELLNGNQLDDYAWDVFKSECDEAGWEADEREMNELEPEWWQEILDDALQAQNGDY